MNHLNYALYPPQIVLVHWITHPECRKETVLLFYGYWTCITPSKACHCWNSDIGR